MVCVFRVPEQSCLTYNHPPRFLRQRNMFLDYQTAATVRLTVRVNRRWNESRFPEYARAFWSVGWSSWTVNEIKIKSRLWLATWFSIHKVYRSSENLARYRPRKITNLRPLYGAEIKKQLRWRRNPKRTISTEESFRKSTNFQNARLSLRKPDLLIAERRRSDQELKASRSESTKSRRNVRKTLYCN